MFALYKPIHGATFNKNFADFAFCIKVEAQEVL